MNKGKVAVIGQGYVGLPIALSAAKAGFNVVGFDTNPDIVVNLNAGNSHIADIQDSFLLSFLESGFYKGTSNPSEFSDAEIVVIAVPTPLDSNRNPDLSYLMSACEIVGKHLQVEALVINESTSFPGTLRNIISKQISELSNKEHLYAVSPERVDPGNRDWKIDNTHRIISGLTDEATRKARQFYESFCESIIEVSTPEVAEAAKLFENTFRQVNIALVNELALISRSLGISVREVLDAADTKPYGFMKFNPGLGVGGHCIPVDPSYLAFVARNSGSDAAFIELANKVNLQMPKKIVERVRLENLGTLAGKKILVCGISYKPDVSDVRESPSIELIKLLRAEGADVCWHDPVVVTYGNQTSVTLSESKFEVTILAIKHKEMDLDLIAKSADYVFDCLGLIPSAIQL